MGRINEHYYSDYYITPDKQLFVPDPQTEACLIPYMAEDLEEFYHLL